MHYKTGYCFNASDLFDTFNKKQLKIKKTTLEKNYGVHSRQLFCASVFAYCCYLILLDIIENNATFVLPLFANKHASIYVRPLMGDALKLALQRGGCADIDLLSSNFTGYQLTYTWEVKKGWYRHKPVYINKRFKDILLKYINEGKQYY